MKQLLHFGSIKIHRFTKRVNKNDHLVKQAYLTNTKGKDLNMESLVNAVWIIYSLR